MPYSEADIRAIYIDPALLNSDWKHDNIKREFYFKYLDNNKELRGFVDYLLIDDGNYLAIIEAKRADKKANSGLQKAIHYAKILQIRFVYATNGEEIYEYDMSSGRGQIIPHFPSLRQLLEKTRLSHLTLKETLHNIPFFIRSNKYPYHHQQTAIQRLIESIADRNKKALINMPVGTGKSFVIFQVLYKLIQSRWNIEGANRSPKILFLADQRGILQQNANLFNQLGSEIPLIFINDANSVSGNYPKSGVFFSTYQMLFYKKKKLERFRRFSKGFFDIVVADEYHKPSISDGGEFAKVLEYFTDAVQIGVSSSILSSSMSRNGFKEAPVFEYSLVDAFKDSILTPFKIYRTNLIKVPFEGKDIELPKNFIFYEQSRLMAKEILRLINPMEKTIIFCKDQKHALELCEIINSIKTIDNPEYCVRITSADGNGKELLTRFKKDATGMPIIITTAKLLTTGLDVKELRNIVICRPIGSLVELLQIIQRGTRMAENKDFFNVIDFFGATDLLFENR